MLASMSLWMHNPSGSFFGSSSGKHENMPILWGSLIVLDLLILKCLTLWIEISKIAEDK